MKDTSPCTNCSKCCNRKSNGLCQKCYRRCHYLKNKELVLKQSAIYYEKNKQVYLDNRKEKYHQNLDKSRTRCRLKQRKLRQDPLIREKETITRRNKRKQVLNHMGFKCNNCGENRRIFLNIDHVNNDGNIDRNLLKKSTIITFKSHMI